MTEPTTPGGVHDSIAPTTSVEQTVGGKDPAAARTEQPAEALAARSRFEQDSPQGFTDEDSYRMDLLGAAVGDVSFPATKETALAAARANGAQDAVLSDLTSLPDGARYETLDALLLALGVGTAGRVDVPGVPERDPEGGASGPAR